MQTAIGPLQIRILEVMERHHLKTVQEVHDALNAQGHRPLAYTTALTVIRNLTRRGFLKQEKYKAIRAHHFKLAKSLREIRRDYAREFLQLMFAGDVGEFCAAVGNA